MKLFYTVAFLMTLLSASLASAQTTEPLCRSEGEGCTQNYECASGICSQGTCQSIDNGSSSSSSSSSSDLNTYDFYTGEGSLYGNAYDL